MTIDDVERARQPLIPTSDLGLLPFPKWCPSWCDRGQHLKFAGESDGCYDAYEVMTHRSRWHHGQLTEVRFPSGDIARDRGGQWDIHTRQSLREPYTATSGYTSPPLVELSIADSGLGTEALIGMTTGETRVLAAQLIALADLVDIGAGK